MSVAEAAGISPLDPAAAEPLYRQVYGRLRDAIVRSMLKPGSLLTGKRARQPDFLTPYLKAVFAIIGLHDLTFFSVEGAAFGPEYLENSRRTAAAAVQAHFC